MSDRKPSKYKQRHPKPFPLSEEFRRWHRAAMNRDEDEMEAADRAWKARFMPEWQPELRRAA